MRNQKGFTLIELIIVIVVLGILAVTAAPQFVNFSSDARASTLKGLEGSIKAANQVVLGRASLDDALEGEDTVTVKGSTVNTIFGYPKAAADGIENALDLSDGDFSFLVQTAGVYTISGDPDAIDTQGELIIAPVDVLDDTPTAAEAVAGLCYVEYTDPADENSKPIITVETDGC